MRNGIATAAPLGFAEACRTLAAEGTDSWTPSAWFEAAVALLLTPCIVARVFWIMLGLWAEARPAASTHPRIVVAIVIAGFIVSPYFLAGGVPGLLAGPAGSRS